MKGSLRRETAMIRVILPPHLRTLAKVGTEVQLELEGPATQRIRVRGREAEVHVTKQRRPFLRFFACEEDLSHEPPDAPLPEAVATGKEPFVVLGAIAGG